MKAINKTSGLILTTILGISTIFNAFFYFKTNELTYLIGIFSNINLITFIWLVFWWRRHERLLHGFTLIVMEDESLLTKLKEKLKC